MRAGTRKESIESRGGTAWNDGLHPVNGAGTVDGGITQAQDISVGVGSASSKGAATLGETSWFAPVEEMSDCTDGVCPVPWAKGIEALASSKFLSEDRNSNFPGENTIKEQVIIQPDLVNHPPHYASGAIECIEAIEAQLTPEEYRGYLKGNCVKYQWRERQKGGLESLKKAQWYLNRLIALDESAQKG